MKYYLIHLLSTVFVLFIFNQAVGQNSTDTLQLAKKLREEGQLKSSVKLLSKYYKNHPNDLNTLWLYGNTAYLNNDNKLAVKIYRKAVKLFPENYSLQLDFAKILTTIGKLNEAGPILEKCLKKDPTNKEAEIYLATVYYWQLKYKEASAILNTLLQQEPANQTARQLLDKIKEDKSPVLQGGIDLNTDDQPMQTLTPWLKSKMYTSKLHELELKFNAPVFTDDTVNSNAFAFSAGNQFLIGKAGLGLYLEAGIFNNPKEKTSIFTGNIRLDKTLFGKIHLSAGMERKPYYLTLSSAQAPLAENHSYFSASYGKDGNWIIKAGLENSSYPTDNNNNILTAYTWVVSPSLKLGKFDFHLGYGVNFSSADQSRFVSKKSLSQLIADSNFSNIEGVYSPYFTPKNTQVHSALGIMTYKASKKLTFNLKYSYGFYAVTSNPYLFIKEKGNGNGNGNSSGSGSDTLMVSRQFTSMNFNPYEFNADITYQMSRSFSLSGQFKSFQTLYYKSQFVGISFRKVL